MSLTQNPPAGTRCVALSTLDDVENTCIVSLRGSLGRAAITRIDAVLHALEHAPHPVVVDLSAARTREPRLLRLIVRVLSRRRDAGLVARLHGVHPGVLPDLDRISLAESFLVYEATRGPAPTDPQVSLPSTVSRSESAVGAPSGPGPTRTGAPDGGRHRTPRAGAGSTTPTS